jgi:hypothetical protein
LLKNGLLDVLRLAVHPVVVGEPLGSFTETRRHRCSCSAATRAATAWSC